MRCSAVWPDSSLYSLSPVYSSRCVPSVSIRSHLISSHLISSHSHTTPTRSFHSPSLLLFSLIISGFLALSFLLFLFSFLSLSSAATFPEGPLPEIAHSFRAPESRPFALLSLIFTFLCVTPLLALLYSLASSRITFQFPRSGDEMIYSFVFHGSIAAILALYFFYWTVLNIFQALVFLFIFGFVAFFSGSKAARVHAANQNKDKKQN